MSGTVRITCPEPSREKRAVVATQFRETMTPWPQVTCGCGQKIPLRFAFRCLYCTEFYCQRCAEGHFGETRLEWYGTPALHVRAVFP